MSTLLEQASLVMIPSGYKEDVVYSQIPTSGAGDLSFTRASNGTRINSQGLVEVCPWNLYEQSETFENGYWSRDIVTVTANNTTAPNGTITADKITPTNTSGDHWIGKTSFALIVGNSYSYSVYAKDNGYNLVLSVGSLSDYTNCNFNLSSGVASTPYAVNVANLCTATIESVGNGWYRCTITFKAFLASNVLLYSSNNTTSTPTGNFGMASMTGDGVKGFFLWGGQLNAGALKPYFPTTDRLNVPRLTYQNGGGGWPSLLLEPQRTNLLTYSEQFDQWTTLNTTVTANNITSPDGTQNADVIAETTVNSEHQFASSSVSFLASTKYTATIFAKWDAACTRNIHIRLGNCPSVNCGASFDKNGNFVNYTGGGNGTLDSYSSVDIGNGWRRFVVTITTTTTASSGSGIFVYFMNGTSLGYAGSTSQKINFYGAQLEASSYPTSYIPTTSSSATRVADACFKTGISSLIGQTSGSVFLILPEFIPQPAGGAILSLHDGSSANRMGVIVSGSQIIVYIITSNVEQAAYTFTPSSGVQKIAFAYANNDVAIYVNGSAVYTDTSATIPATSAIALNTYGFVGIHAGNSINEVALFKTRLTNAELASLTTI